MKTMHKILAYLLSLSLVLTYVGFDTYAAPEDDLTASNFTLELAEGDGVVSVSLVCDKTTVAWAGGSGTMHVTNSNGEDASEYFTLLSISTEIGDPNDELSLTKWSATTDNEDEGDTIAAGTWTTYVYGVASDTPNDTYKFTMVLTEDDWFDAEMEDYSCSGATLTKTYTVAASTPAVQGYSASISTDAPTVQVNTTASVSVNVAHDSDTKFASGEVKVAIPSGVSVAATGAVKHGTEEVGYYIENSTLIIQDFGAEKDMGNGVYVITYTAGSTAQTVNFVLTSAAFSDAASAAASDLKPATVDSTPLAINIKMAPVTVAEDASAAGFFQYTTPAEYGVAYTFAKETTTGAYYDYTNVQYQVGNGAWMNLTEENGTWTIPASAVTGNITLKATRTGIKPPVTWEGNGAADITTKPTAQYGIDFVVTHPENKPATTEPGYKYSISALMGTTPIGSYNESTGTFTIAGNAITGPFTVTVTKTTIAENQYSVTISGTAGLTPDITSSTGVVNKGEDVTLTLTPELGYVYRVTVNGVDKTEEFADNTYTITNVTGAVSVSVAKSVDVTHKGEAHYLTLDGSNMMIVTIKPNEAGDQLTNKLYTYKTNKMFWSDQYKAYCYLEVAGGAATFDAGDETPVFDIVPGSVKSVDYGMDVNMTQKVDANDAQLVYNMYNEGDDLYFDGVDVEKFLRADTNWDMKVNVEDAQKIINYLLKKTEQ